MKKALLDTNILSYFLKGNVELAKRFQKYSRHHQRLTFSLLTYYEIKSGLLYRDAGKLMAQFEQLATEIRYRFICVHLRSSAVVFNSNHHQKPVPDLTQNLISN